MPDKFKTVHVINRRINKNKVSYLDRVYNCVCADCGCRVNTQATKYKVKGKK